MPSFVRYLLVRALRGAATVFGVITLVFLLLHLIPGAPVQAMLGDQASPEERVALRRALHLDRPLPEQYVLFCKDLVSGGLGQSFRDQTRSVASLIVEVVPEAEPGVTVMNALVPLTAGLIVSVAVTVRAPVVSSVYALVNVCTPASPPVNV